jgi:phage shock protein A
MAQQTIFGRIANLARANINALIDGAEDPEKMLDQLIRDYTSSIVEAEDAVAQTLGNLRLLEDDAREVQQAIGEWGNKAAAAVSRSEQLRAGGQDQEAERFENLARIALQRQVEHEKQLADMQPNIASQTEVVAQLRAGLDGMRNRLDELKRKRDELVSRAKMAQAQAQVHDAVRAIDLNDPLSEVSRFEEKIRREEAKVRGQTELAASSLDAQFESLEDLGTQAEVDARLAALRGGSGGGAGDTPAGEPPAAAPTDEG